MLAATASTFEALDQALVVDALRMHAPAGLQKMWLERRPDGADLHGGSAGKWKRAIPIIPAAIDGPFVTDRSRETQDLMLLSRPSH